MSKPETMPRKRKVREVSRRICFLGLRNVPRTQGGIERHVENLAPEIAKKGFDVQIIVRRPYMHDPAVTSWKGMAIKSLYAPVSKYFETPLHTLLGVLLAAIKRPDLLHLHAIGPGLFTPLARLLGLKVIVTHHGYDYDRDKWNTIARIVLKTGEFVAMRFANERIAVSAQIAEQMQSRYGVKVHYIPNGVSPISFPIEKDCLQELGLAPRSYILITARLVPEKRQSDLIEAFAALDSDQKKGMKLAIVGEADHKDTYSRELKGMAEAHDDIVMTGFQTGESLKQLYAHARLFVLPSSHEGMPISLLEALSFGLPVLASDIVANKALELDESNYFPLGDIKALSLAIAKMLAIPFDPEAAEKTRTRLDKAYNWEKIAGQTTEIYNNVISR